ncbi:hypothetical protein T4A_1400 [Trichinella pseudospiralis]|uniref:Uncharacterized protein n=1 Tax=Trichinella pseudospiralis TaxID=6337 RepID=A0A0V1K7U4_TRIPS|nr:hypothetical protein T4A_1400 [Trichinella pseudospiralis]KRZ43296.1 hypothetical protein T4C_2537 [Trichinella pseudospiralis]
MYFFFLPLRIKLNKASTERPGKSVKFLKPTYYVLFLLMIYNLQSVENCIAFQLKKNSLHIELMAWLIQKQFLCNIVASFFNKDVGRLLHIAV